jgi:hypothetical protein
MHKSECEAVESMPASVCTEKYQFEMDETAGSEVLRTGDLCDSQFFSFSGNVNVL